MMFIGLLMFGFLTSALFNSNFFLGASMLVYMLAKRGSFPLFNKEV